MWLSLGTYLFVDESCRKEELSPPIQAIEFWYPTSSSNQNYIFENLPRQLPKSIILEKYYLSKTPVFPLLLRLERTSLTIPFSFFFFPISHHPVPARSVIFTFRFEHTREVALPKPPVFPLLFRLEKHLSRYLFFPLFSSSPILHTSVFREKNLYIAFRA